jgi:hypothetical protein
MNIRSHLRVSIIAAALMGPTTAYSYEFSNPVQVTMINTRDGHPGVELTANIDKLIITRVAFLGGGCGTKLLSSTELPITIALRQSIKVFSDKQCRPTSVSVTTNKGIVEIRQM